MSDECGRRNNCRPFSELKIIIETPIIKANRCKRYIIKGLAKLLEGNQYLDGRIIQYLSKLLSSIISKMLQTNKIRNDWVQATIKVDLNDAVSIMVRIAKVAITKLGLKHIKGVGITYIHQYKRVEGSIYNTKEYSIEELSNYLAKLADNRLALILNELHWIAKFLRLYTYNLEVLRLQTRITYLNRYAQSIRKILEEKLKHPYLPVQVKMAIGDLLTSAINEMIKIGNIRKSRLIETEANFRIKNDKNLEYARAELKIDIIGITKYGLTPVRATRITYVNWHSNKFL